MVQVTLRLCPTVTSKDSRQVYITKFNTSKRRVYRFLSWSRYVKNIVYDGFQISLRVKERHGLSCPYGWGCRLLVNGLY